MNGEAIYGSSPWRKAGEHREVTLERIDPTIDFYWNRNGPGHPIREDDFTAEWCGYLEAPQTGDYTFSASADDGVRAWVDGRLVVDEWDDAEPGAAGPTIRLVGGLRVPIRVEYREEKVTASVRLEWSGPRIRDRGHPAGTPVLVGRRREAMASPPPTARCSSTWPTRRRTGTCTRSPSSGRMASWSSRFPSRRPDTRSRSWA